MFESTRIMGTTSAAGSKVLDLFSARVSHVERQQWVCIQGFTCGETNGFYTDNADWITRLASRGPRSDPRHPRPSQPIYHLRQKEGQTRM